MTSKTSEEKIKKFIEKTGFILEMKVSQYLIEQNWQVEVGNSFIDLEEMKRREIDIVATKIINNIEVTLIIECKQSNQDQWVFICSSKNPTRFYYSTKHSPKIKTLSSKKILNVMHTMDKTVSLAQNYITFDKRKNKKANTLQIEESLYKLPKSLIDVARKSIIFQEEKKKIFIPCCIFSDEIFSAQYSENGLSVKEQPVIQYNIQFEPKAYSKKNRLKIDESFTETLGKESVNISPLIIEMILDIADKFGTKYQIDFVSNKHLKDYLNKVEEGVKLISTRKWSMNVK